MKLIIDIPDKVYKSVLDGNYCGSLYEELLASTPIDKGDLIMFNLLMTTIADKGLPFEEVLLLIDNAKTPYNPTGDLISREALKRTACVKFYTTPYYKHILDLIDNAQAVDLWQMRQEATENALKKAEVLYGRPKGDLISREALKEALSKEIKTNDMGLWLKILLVIDNAPPAPERPQGEWLEYNATGKKQYMCSECSMKEKNPKIARYCYWCGADMRKGGAESYTIRFRAKGGDDK